MARIRAHLHYSDTRAELAEYKDARHGAVEDAFWDEDELVDYRPSSKRKRPKKKGCPGNDYKAHVYVWVDEKVYRTKFNPMVGFVQDRSRPPYTVRRKTCCGCMKVAKSHYDWTNYYG